MLQDPFASPTLSRGLAWWFMSHAAERMLWYYWSFMAPFKTPELCPANGHLLLWRTIMFTLHKVLDRSGSFSQNKKYKAMQSSAEKSTASEPALQVKHTHDLQRNKSWQVFRRPWTQRAFKPELAYKAGQRVFNSHGSDQDPKRKVKLVACLPVTVLTGLVLETTQSEVQTQNKTAPITMH